MTASLRSLEKLPKKKHQFSYRDSVYRHSRRIVLDATFDLREGDKDEINDMMADYMNRRLSKQPLEFPSAGSVFKRYPGRFTGQMIEEAGLKGLMVGGAEVSTKHAGFIVNRGNATCQDVLTLIEIIKQTILDKDGCELECEVIHVC